MLNKLRNILLNDFIFFLFLILVSSFYYLLSANLILFVLLGFLFFLLNFYLISSLNYSLDDNIGALKNSFIELINKNISLIKKIKKIYKNNYSFLFLESSFYFLLNFKGLLYKFIFLKSSTTFLKFIDYYHLYYLKLGIFKRGLILKK